MFTQTDDYFQALLQRLLGRTSVNCFLLTSDQKLTKLERKHSFCFSIITNHYKFFGAAHRSKPVKERKLMSCINALLDRYYVDFETLITYVFKYIDSHSEDRELRDTFEHAGLRTIVKASKSVIQYEYYERFFRNKVPHYIQRSKYVLETYNKAVQRFLSKINHKSNHKSLKTFIKPGGKREDKDRTYLETLVRELNEEGFKPDGMKVYDGKQFIKLDLKSDELHPSFVTNSIDKCHGYECLDLTYIVYTHQTSEQVKSEFNNNEQLSQEVSDVVFDDIKFDLSNFDITSLQALFKSLNCQLPKEPKNLFYPFSKKQI